MIKSVKINGLRGFGEENNISFSLPNGKLGSGLNFIVGPNNTGKTTIIEALRLHNIDNNYFGTITFSEGKRNKNNNSIINIEFVDENDDVSIIRTLPEGGSSTETINCNKDDIAYCLSSRRYSDYYMNSNSNFDRNSFSISHIVNTKNRTSTIMNYESRIFDWQKNKNKFDKILKDILGKDFDWTIEQEDNGNYYIKVLFNNKTISHTREGMGDGYWSIFTIVDTLYDFEENKTIIIDEPELSLHPSLQKKVINYLEDYSKTRQIIIATHSPYFISIKALINGGNLIRTFKDEKYNIHTGSIDELDRKFFDEVSKDINSPHVFGLDGRELFFLTDHITITEGQEDVVIISKLCNDLNITTNFNLFGWGAGGYAKIKKVLHLLQNLKFRKVTAIYDGDQKKEFLEVKESYPNYNFIILPKDDIRAKNEKNNKAKEGITFENGRIKMEYKDYFINLMNSINEYNKSIENL